VEYHFGVPNIWRKYSQCFFNLFGENIYKIKTLTPTLKTVGRFALKHLYVYLSAFMVFRLTLLGMLRVRVTSLDDFLPCGILLIL
jgi:hypothetical protein